MVRAYLTTHSLRIRDKNISGNPTRYETFLNSRADSTEINAIKGILELAEKYRYVAGN